MQATITRTLFPVHPKYWVPVCGIWYLHPFCSPANYSPGGPICIIIAFRKQRTQIWFRFHFGMSKWLKLFYGFCAGNYSLHPVFACNQNIGYRYAAWFLFQKEQKCKHGFGSKNDWELLFCSSYADGFLFSQPKIFTGGGGMHHNLSEKTWSANMGSFPFCAAKRWQIISFLWLLCRQLLYLLYVTLFYRQTKNIG